MSIENDAVTHLSLPLSLPCSQTIRCVCVLVPPLLFVLLRTMELDLSEVRSDLLAGGIILLWSIGMSGWLWRSRRIALSAQYESALKRTAVEHVGVIVLAALVLDHGLTLRACLLATAIFWMLTGIVLARRPDCPRPSDVTFVSWGLPVLAFLTSTVAWFISTAAPWLLV